MHIAYCHFVERKIELCFDLLILISFHWQQNTVSNGTGTHNRLVCKRALTRFAQPDF